MNKLMIAVFVSLAAMCSGAAAESKLDFDGRGAESFDFSRALKETASEASEVGPVCAETSAGQAVKLLIREGFYGAGSMAALDAASGSKVAAYKRGADWTAEVSGKGYKDAAKIKVKGNRFAYVSGDTILALERNENYFLLFGSVSAELGGGTAFELDESAASGFGGSFELKSPGASLNFSPGGVAGRAATPRLAGALAALYMAAVSDSVPGIYRRLPFTDRGNIPDTDENGGGWSSCSQTGGTWNWSDNEWRREQSTQTEEYICKNIATYNCNWKGSTCKEYYPHTQPGQCYCKYACGKTVTQTSECQWQVKE